MFTKGKLHCAVLSAMSVTYLERASSQVDESGYRLEEMMVTATKRSERMQEVPIAITAMATEAIEELGVSSFQDYVKWLPNVTSGGRGPGQNEIYIRGAATQAINIAIAEANGSAPNIALYLDEQPVTAGGRNLDVYITDIERIEVLAGPQGTLFGASSQAGTVRIITNKPNLDQFEASVDMSTSFTKDGGMSNALESMLNIPIIEDRLAVRLTFFNDHKAGYIDNVNGRFVPDSSENPALPNNEGIEFVSAGGDPNAHEFANGTFAEPGRTYEVQHTEVNNTHLVEEDFNDALYQGFRFGVKYVVNDDWTVTAQYHQQQLQADGVFDYDPDVGDLQVQRYNPDKLQDEFEQTSLTLEGRLGELDLIYTGGYLNRNIDQIIDYTNYVNTGSYIAGYTCEYNTPGYHGGGGVGYVFDPTLSGDPDIIECTAANGFILVDNESERFTHELRVSGYISDKIQVTTGIYYEDSETRHVGDFVYGNPNTNPVDPMQLNSGRGPTTANNPNVRDSRIQFTNDITRPENQISLFGELTYDFNDNVSATLGYRYYELEVGFKGFSAWKYGNRIVSNLEGEAGVTVAPNATGGRDYNVNIGQFQPFNTEDSIVKANISWDITDDIMLYGTYSEGYRPAGFNRAVASGQLVDTGQGTPSTAARANGTPGFDDYFIPLVYESDELTNHELGLKTTLADGLLRLNTSIYHIDWTSIQIGHIDNANISLFTIVDNGGDAEINGIETDFVWLVTESLTLFGAFSYNDATLVDKDPGFGFALVDEGAELPLTPKMQANLRARYEWELDQGEVHFQLAGKYAHKSYSSLIEANREEQDSYFLSDLALGYSTDSWSTEFFINNLTDERAQLHINTSDGSRKVTTNRPLTMGMRLSYDFY